MTDIRGRDFHTFGVERATPTSKSTTPMHVSASPGWQRTVCWTKIVRCQLAREIFRHKKAFHRPERALCWSGRPLVGLKGPSFGLIGTCDDLKRPCLA